MVRPVHKFRRMGVNALALALLAFGAGCAEFPDLDAAQTPGVAQAPYPKLVPLDGLIVDTPARATTEVIAGVEGRVAGLQARANRLRAMRPRPKAVSGRLARLRQKAAVLRAFQGS